MKFRNHFFVSSIISVIIYYFYKNYAYTISLLLSSVFIDLDHCYDYFRETGDYKISLKKMEKLFYAYDYKKATIILHSYELIFIFFIINIFLFHSIIIYGIISGFLLHIILDIIFNPVYAKAYSFFYRLNHSFVKEKILKM
jgi:hypothetical protein